MKLVHNLLGKDEDDKVYDRFKGNPVFCHNCANSTLILPCFGLAKSVPGQKARQRRTGFL